VLFAWAPCCTSSCGHRIPTIVPREWTRERRSIFWTDVGLAASIALMGTLVGFREFALVQLP